MDGRQPLDVSTISLRLLMLHGKCKIDCWRYGCKSHCLKNSEISSMQYHIAETDYPFEPRDLKK
jgi:hypothetical protein